MQKNYELLYIVHPDLEGSTEKITEKVAGFVTKAGGTVASQEDWGKRKLAYKIAKNEYGVYVLVNFALESTALADVERDLRLSEEIMRSMVVIVPELSAYQAARKKPRIRKEEVAEVVEKKEEPSNIIVTEEKPKRAPRKKADVAAEVIAEETPAKEAKPKKTAAATKATAAATKKAEKVAAAVETERLAKLDAKLDELLK